MANAPTSLVRITKPVVMLFPALVTPRAYKNKEGSEAYSASFVLPTDHPAIAELKASIIAVAKDKWPGRDIGADVKAQKFMLPFRRGEALIEDRKRTLLAKGKEYKGDNDFLIGTLVVKASTKKYPPMLGYWDNARKAWVDLDDGNKKQHENKFFFGAEALAEINLSAYDRVNSNALDGVTAYLQKVYVTGKGKRLTGGEPGSQTFAGYVGHASEEDPTQGMNDEIPF